ncbi:MAG: hypothetical protein WA989_17965, partial [Henriciella sp.]|uniref:hypothetical protein n=1 Tax=Henriciella sp. TaxID=1968823 RepID=UPI003C7657FE
MGLMARLVLVTLTVLLSSCSEAMLKAESNGRQIPPDYPLMVASGADPAILQQVSGGQPNLVNSGAPTDFEFVDADPNCRMPRPSSRAKLAFVYTYGGGEKTPLQYVADSKNAGQLQSRIDRQRLIAGSMSDSSFEQSAMASQAAAFARGNSVEWVTRIDVLVTETDAPVFLVLTSYNAVMWNIQTASGADIDGIIVSAYEGGAIANGVDERRTGFMGFRGAPNLSCYLKGQGQPATVETRIAGAKELNPDFDASRYRDRWAEEYK